jgi:hypothetical protein
MEAGALGPRDVGAHAFRCPRAQVGERHHLKSRGQADPRGEPDVGYVGGVSYFDHLLSRAYLGAADLPA